MNKWLAGLIITAVGLPLLMFFGNLKPDVSEESEAGSEAAPEQVGLEDANADSITVSVSQGLQEPPTEMPETSLSYPPWPSNGNENNEKESKNKKENLS